MFYDESAQNIDLYWIDRHQIPAGNYNHHLDWHWGWEVWAYQAGIQYPGHDMGSVPHFNIIGDQGIQYHVYVNAYGYYEAVPAGGRPSGF